MDLTTNQAAAQLGVSPQRVRQYIEAGRIQARKFGRDWIVDSASVDAFRPRPPGNPDLEAARELKKTRRAAERDHDREAARRIRRSRVSPSA